MATPDFVEAKMVRVFVNASAPTAANIANFKRLCAMRARAFNQTKNLQEHLLPDCADPSLASTIRRSLLSVDFGITGNAVYEPQQRPILQAAFDAKGSVPCLFVIPAGEQRIGAGYYTGNFFLTQLNFTGSETELLMADLTFVGDGKATWTAQ